MTAPRSASNYVYYRIREDQAAAARVAARRMCDLLAERGRESPVLRRRPDTSAQGLQTWMEVYVRWNPTDASPIERAVSESGLGPLIQGERHSEVFVDLE